MEGLGLPSQGDRVLVRVPCSPRVATKFQEVDFEIGRILRQVLERKLYRELGFESFERYVGERLDLSPRTARRPGSARRGARTWRGIARRSARTTTIAGYMREGWRFAGGRPMA
jgi:hypothetical protein